MFDFFIIFLLILAFLYVGSLIFFYFMKKFKPKVFDDIINCKWDRD
jgi:hypothetical protein